MWSECYVKEGQRAWEENDSRYLKLALPKTLRKVKSGSTGVLLPACLDMRKGNNLTVSGTRNRPGHREGKYLGKMITSGGQAQSKAYPRQMSGCKTEFETYGNYESEGK